MARRRRVPPRRQGQQAAAAEQPRAPARAKSFLAVVALGLACGVGAALVIPASGLLARDRARAALLADTAGALETSAAFANDDDAALIASAALAHTLLAVDHAGGLAARKRAAALLKTSVASVRTAPEALYARALLKHLGSDDATLDDDIAKKADKARSGAQWALLARASSALDAGKPDEALALLQKAALGSEAPLRAQTELALLLVARGELGDARALAERARRLAPEHGPSRIVGVLAAVLDDLREETAEERAIKLKKLRGKGPRKGTASAGDDDETARVLSLWRTPEEEEATLALDHIDERDGALLALFLQALSSARGDEEQATSLRSRVVPIAMRRPALAARQIELSLLEGDLATAEELLTALEPVVESGDEPELALAGARLAAVKLLPEEELRKRAGGPRSLTRSGAVLPLGELAFDPSLRALPLVARFDPLLVPDAALLDAMRSGLSGPALQQKLDSVVLVHKGHSALRRGDLAAASQAAGLARATAPADPEVLFLDARIRLRQADHDGARDAIDAGIAAAPDNPRVLLVGARLHYDNEGFIPARKALKRLLALGFKSPAALALDAMLDARAGDARSAQAALAEARAIGADDAAILRANLLILREGRDLPAAREAANRLSDVDRLRSTDPILRAWQADAIARNGDKGRATLVLEEIIAQRNLGDAHFFLAELGGDPAGYARAAELAPGTVLALEAVKQRGPVKPTKTAPLPKQKPKR